MTTSEVEVSDLKPLNFQAKMEASACYLEVDKHLLLIQQTTGRADEGRWGAAGKLERNETPEIAVKRELFEETGIEIQAPSQIQYLGTLYIRKPELDYVLIPYVKIFHRNALKSITEANSQHNKIQKEVEMAGEVHFYSRKSLAEIIRNTYDEEGCGICKTHGAEKIRFLFNTFGILAAQCYHMNPQDSSDETF